MKHRMLALVLAPLLMAGAVITVYGQRGLPTVNPSPGHESRDEKPPSLPKPSPSRKMLKESFEQTQKDVDELSDLVAELKEETDKADPDVLSITVVKKAEAIEKLAEKIKNRMKSL